MTRVSFYLLAVSEPAERRIFACRLAEKAVRKGHTVYLHVPDDAEAKAMDELLWTFRDDSFVPHRLLDDPVAAGEAVPVAIGCGDDPGPYHDVLINLALDIPEFFSRFERVSEIVIEEESVQQAKREGWRFYRDRGYPGEHHRVGAASRP